MYAVALALTLAAAGLLWYDHTHKSPRFASGDRVALFGDSLAQGLRTPLKTLAASSGVDMVSDVQPGTRLDQWVQRGPQVAKGARYALISLGTNDSVANDAHQAQMGRWAMDISASLRGLGVTPIWILPPPMRFSTDRAVAAIRATGDAVLVSADYPRYDSIHPTPAAFGAWASDIWAAVGPRLAAAETASGFSDKSCGDFAVWVVRFGEVCVGSASISKFYVVHFCA
jgi:hypothetical protein